MSVDYKLIGKRIKEARKAEGLTQDALAEKLEVTVGYVSQVERGITKISLDLLARISAVLKRDIADFVLESACDSKAYLKNEFTSQFSLLTQKEKKLTLAFIKLLIENRLS